MRSADKVKCILLVARPEVAYTGEYKEHSLKTCANKLPSSY